MPLWLLNAYSWSIPAPFYAVQTRDEGIAWFAPFAAYRLQHLLKHPGQRLGENVILNPPPGGRINCIGYCPRPSGHQHPIRCSE